jgi:ketosteroid isomerase-like protein
MRDPTACMSRQNIATFSRLVEALNRADIVAVLPLVSEDVVLIAARSAVQGPYLGHAGVRDFLADNAQSFEVFRMQVSEVRDLGDELVVVGTIRIRGRGGGVETDVPVGGIARFADGKLTHWEDFRDRRRALEAAGLSE